MDWDTLNDLIPWQVESWDTPEITIHSSHGRVTVRKGKKTKKETEPPGGDFIVSVTSDTATTPAGKSMATHRFDQSTLLRDFERKTDASAAFMRDAFAKALVRVVAEGENPATLVQELSPPLNVPGIDVETLLVASQCLALSEHRKYARNEPLGGRCLPTRFALGVIFGLWSAFDATERIWLGAHRLADLRKKSGSSEPTFEEVLGRPLRSDACRGPDAN